MQDEQTKRKPRIPLSKEELFYVKEIKKFKEQHKVEVFKKTNFYKILNTTNVVLAGFLSYCLLSILICCHWNETKIINAECHYGSYNRLLNAREIIEIELHTLSNNDGVTIKTSDLFQVPKQDDIAFIGTDFVFNKIIKVKLANQNQTYWHIYTYPTFIVCLFAMCFGFFIYKVNKHLSINGLLTVFGLFTLASLYFILI